MGIVIKTLKTAKGHYVYDRSTNCILKISPSQYEELVKVEKGLIAEVDASTVINFQRKNYLNENVIEIIEHPYTCFLNHILDTHIEQITLQVTQRCNLRCKYCTYAGIYDNHNRTHANYDMTWEMAKKAIDFYLQRTTETKRLDFGFYGGEPLLKMELIKKCVSYINSVVKNKKVSYSITTNGTLLNLEIAQFLFENNFMVTISLDGSKKEHDKYRIFPNGEGSFELIMENLRQIKRTFPGDFKNICFNAVLNPDNDFKHLKLYFEEDEVIGDSDVMASIVDNFSAEDVNFGEEFYRARAFEQFKLYLFMLGKLEMADVSKLVLLNSADIRMKYQRLSNHIRLGGKAHHAGPCVPGAKRLFVNVFGELFPCEKVAEESNMMKIGTLEKGFDREKVSQLLNIGKLTEHECKNCWAINYCTICCQNADAGELLSREKKLLYCKASRNDAYENLLEICTLKELGCTFSEKGISIYEKVGLSSEL